MKGTTAPARTSDPGLVESEAEFAAHLERVNEQNRRALARLKPHELARLKTWLRTRTHDAPPVRPPPTPASGRAPREARNGRVRGSRRSSARRSSERSGDSGDPDEEPARVCANARCRADISHLHVLAEYCDNSGACKQAAYRDRQTLEHLDGLAGTVAVGVSCRCTPKGHLVIGGVCFACGKPRGAVTRAWLDDEGVQARSFVTTPAARGAWRLRPDRELSTKLRGTRRDWKVAA